jgi:hypothetical protein
MLIIVKFQFKVLRKERKKMNINWQAVFNAEIAWEAILQILEGLPYTLSLSLIGFALELFVAFSSHCYECPRLLTYAG